MTDILSDYLEQNALFPCPDEDNFPMATSGSTTSVGELGQQEVEVGWRTVRLERDDDLSDRLIRTLDSEEEFAGRILSDDEKDKLRRRFSPDLESRDPPPPPWGRNPTSEQDVIAFSQTWC